MTMAQADTIEELAARLDIDPEGLANTVQEYNAAVQKDTPYNPTVKDGRRTEGLEVDKTNWAETLDTPPYLGFAVTTGISFTFGGVKINNRGQVVTNAQEPIPGLYAAGEMVAASSTTTTPVAPAYRRAWSLAACRATAPAKTPTC